MNDLCYLSGSDEEDEAVVPGEVAGYLAFFANAIENEDNVDEVRHLYESAFPDLTERFFRERMWPDEHQVEAIVGPGRRIFIILYKELYYRQLYARNQRGPSLTHRYESFMNYQDLFSEVLHAKEPLKLALPNIWLWDIVDEFVYQFQAFCLFKANLVNIDELMNIEKNPNAWNIYPVLNILYLLQGKSQINEQLAATKANQNSDIFTDEFGKSPLYFKLGYFSLVGLLRTHVLLADYHQALKTVEGLEMGPKYPFPLQGLIHKVPSSFVTLHYFVGFSHLMMRNYGEATKIFVNCLLYIQRMKSVQPQNQQAKKNVQYDVVKDQLYQLLAICLTLQPQRIDDVIHSQLQERLGDRLSRMAIGDVEEFALCFRLGCPKFLSPTMDVYEGGILFQEPLARQCKAFLEGIESQIALPILRGYLKLYTTLPTHKLASLMNLKESDYDSFLGKLLTFKMIVNELGADSSDVEENTMDIDFYVYKDMIVIKDTKMSRKGFEHFIKHIHNLYEVVTPAMLPPVERMEGGGRAAVDGAGAGGPVLVARQVHVPHEDRREAVHRQGESALRGGGHAAVPLPPPLADETRVDDVEYGPGESVDVQFLGELKKECYCGLSRVIGDSELFCSRCCKWFHGSCLNLVGFDGLPFMVCYEFTCKGCSTSNEEIWIPKHANYSQMCVTVLANLMFRRCRIEKLSVLEPLPSLFFDLKTDIVPFMVEFWAKLTGMKPKIDDRWHYSVKKALISKPYIFVVDTANENRFALVETDLRTISPNHTSIQQITKRGGQLSQSRQIRDSVVCDEVLNANREVKEEECSSGDSSYSGSDDFDYDDNDVKLN